MRIQADPARLDWAEAVPPGCKPRRVILDMSQVQTLDVEGLLELARLKARLSSRSALELVNVMPGATALLHRLGLDQVLGVA